ncbi:Rrf2 family transcriptional regulator [Oceanicola sp. 502str15]|uniref:Rrf2 family transcriptional regulator n=1 Tax=Oceanicola sp. 502str15 TaxID=2696061 RepID=UPI00209477EE|nr:Rrf2 family transcriptional regulator [Oceanicola sp. 502str15]MCO6383160.1 Rrf2 family transcriptional regulator [Oceanicola sp. 502str15]
MKRDSRLSMVLHALLHMAEHEGPVSSEVLAKCMSTNPVVVRRTMGLLREAGLVRATRGAAGGWEMAVPLGSVTLKALHEALGEPTVFAIGNKSEAPGCLVEQSVNAVMDEAFAAAEALLLERFAAVTLADLAAEFGARFEAHRTGGTAGISRG